MYRYVLMLQLRKRPTRKEELRKSKTKDSSFRIEFKFQFFQNCFLINPTIWKLGTTQRTGQTFYLYDWNRYEGISSTPNYK